MLLEFVKQVGVDMKDEGVVPKSKRTEFAKNLCLLMSQTRHFYSGWFFLSKFYVPFFHNRIFNFFSVVNFFRI